MAPGVLALRLRRRLPAAQGPSLCNGRVDRREIAHSAGSHPEGTGGMAYGHLQAGDLPRPPMHTTSCCYLAISYGGLLWGDCHSA